MDFTIFTKGELLQNVHTMCKTKLPVKKRPQHRCFPVKFEKFLRAHILKNNCKRLLPAPQ